MPTNLEDWTYESLLALLNANVYEDDRFDWKVGVPRGRDADRLIKSAVGMANGNGGFFIFGVTDDRRLSGVHRIEGVPDDVEVPKEVAELLRKADPEVPSRPGQPPIQVPSKPGRVVCVVEVLSTVGPHSYEHVFYKRTPRGSDEMSTAEVRDMFIRKEERLRRVDLLGMELDAACEALGDAEAKPPLLRRIDTRMFAELHATLLPLLPDDTSKELVRFRSQSERFNACVDSALVYLGKGDFGGNRSQNNQVSDVMCKRASQARKALEDVRALLDRDFSTKRG